MIEFVDYDYYKDVFKGTVVPSTSFKSLSIKASYFINDITFGRVKKMESITDEVKMATCAVINEMYKVENDGGIKASETVGKHSVTYAGKDNINENKQYYFVACIFLSDTGLLYRGVR